MLCDGLNSFNAADNIKEGPGAKMQTWVGRIGRQGIKECRREECSWAQNGA